jgi:hypothetical protein
MHAPVQPDSQSGVHKRRESWHHGQWGLLPVPVHLHTDQKLHKVLGRHTSLPRSMSRCG